VLTIGLILIVISVLIFFITQGLPGNVARLIAGQFATPDVVAAVEAKLGLNDPLLTQYWRWASGILSGDLGQSLIMERPIGPMLREALANSARLALISIVLVTVVGIGLGVIAAIRHNGPLDHGISVFTFLGIAVPEFFWGIVLILVFAYQVAASGGAGDPTAGWAASFSYLVLPAATHLAPSPFPG
jgi:peptide/nickel transport system permease protein